MTPVLRAFFTLRAAGTGLLLLPLAVAVAIAQPATVYKTVDDNGVVSFSDTPPEEGAAVETLVIDVQTPELTETEQERLDAMRETTDRMVADRLQREKHRAELRQQQASQPQVVEYVVPGSDDDYYPVYYPYPVRRPVRPVHPVHPVHPPLRPQPPGRGDDGVIRPGHDYPASLIRRGYSPEVRAAFER